MQRMKAYFQGNTAFVTCDSNIATQCQRIIEFKDEIIVEH